MAEVLVVGKKISEMELVTNIAGDEKIPTGVVGDKAVTTGQLLTYLDDNGKVQWGRIEGDIANQSDLQNQFAQQLATLQNHIQDQGNPHNVTKEQVGLGSVDNTADMDKPVSTAVQEALANKTHNSLLGRDADGAHPASAILDASGVTQQEINDLTGAPYRVKVGGYSIGERVILENGDIVQSIVAVNTVDPNVAMTGWVRASSYDVESMADLKSLSIPLNGTRIYLKSYHAGLSRGGGFFTFVNTNLATSVSKDLLSGVYVPPNSAPTGASGCWVRDVKDHLNVNWFGAKADGAYDDAPAINAAILLASKETLSFVISGAAVGLSSLTSTYIYAPKGRYMIKSQVNALNESTSIIGEGAVFDGKDLPSSVDYAFKTSWASWQCLFQGLTFVNFDKLFYLDSRNLGGGSIQFENCRFTYVKLCLYSKCQSTALKFQNCYFSMVRKLLYAEVGDFISFVDCSMTPGLWDDLEGSYFFIEHAGSSSTLLEIINMFGNPAEFKGDAQRNKSAWVKTNGAKVSITGSRLGGEGGGMPAVYCARNADRATSISLNDNLIYSRPYDEGVVRLAGIPASISITNNTGFAVDTKLITWAHDADIPALEAEVLSLDLKAYTINIEGNTGTGSLKNMDALYPKVLSRLSSAKRKHLNASFLDSNVLQATKESDTVIRFGIPIQGDITANKLSEAALSYQLKIASTANPLYSSVVAGDIYFTGGVGEYLPNCIKCHSVVSIKQMHGLATNLPTELGVNVFFESTGHNEVNYSQKNQVLVVEVTNLSTIDAANSRGLAYIKGGLIYVDGVL